MATVTIGGMTLGSAGNLTGAAKLEMEDSAGASVYYTAATLRTKMFAGGTGYTAADPLVCGTLNASGTSTLAAVTATDAIFDTTSGNGSGRVQLKSGGTRFGFIGTDTWAFGGSTTDLAIASGAGLGIRFGTNDGTLRGQMTSAGLFDWLGTIKAAGLPTSAGASGTLYVDASGFVKRA